MHEIQIVDNTKYARALGLLHRMGGMFRTRPHHFLTVGPAQYEILVREGLVERNGGKKNRVPKKKSN